MPLTVGRSQVAMTSFRALTQSRQDSVPFALAVEGLLSEKPSEHAKHLETARFENARAEVCVSIQATTCERYLLPN